MSADNIDKLKNNLVKVSSTSLTQSEKAIDIAHKLLFQDIEFNFNEGFKKMNSRQIRHSSINFLQQIESNHNFFNETNLEFEAEFDEDYKDALNLFLKILEIKPQHYYTLVFIGVCYRELDDIDNSLTYINKGIELNSKKFLGYCQRILSYSMILTQNGAFNREIIETLQYDLWEYTFGRTCSYLWVNKSVRVDYPLFRADLVFSQNDNINKLTSNDYCEMISADIEASILAGCNDRIQITSLLKSGIFFRLKNPMTEEDYESIDMVEFDNADEIFLNAGIKELNKLRNRYLDDLNIQFTVMKIKIDLLLSRDKLNEYRDETIEIINSLQTLINIPEFNHKTEALYFQGECYLKIKLIAKAIEKFDNIIELCAPKINCKKYIAAALFRRATLHLFWFNHKRNAIIDLKKCLDLSPQYLPAKMVLTYIKALNKEIEAISEIDETIVWLKNRNFAIHSNQRNIEIITKFRGKLKYVLGDKQSAYIDDPELNPDNELPF